MKKINKKFILIGIVLGIYLIANRYIFATNDPLAVVQNLSDLIFNFMKVIGIIMLGLGIVNIGMAFKSHDPSQRATGIMGAFGGVIITFAKEIIEMITR